MTHPGSRWIGGVQRALLGVVLTLAVAAGVYYLATGGRLRPDDWAMRQIVDLHRTYLVPEFTFRRFRFSLPAQATFSDVAFVAPDGLEVIRAEEVIFTLAEAPRVGEPIRLGKVRVVRGALRLARGRTDKEGVFRGLVPFVRAGVVRSQEALPRERRLSEVLRIDQIDLVECLIEYDDASGRAPLTLDGVTLTARAMARETEGERVWHSLDVQLSRPPALDLRTGGRIDLDDLLLEVRDLSLSMTLEESTIGALPQGVQEVLREHDAQGRVTIAAQGSLPLSALQNSTVSGLVVLDEANVAFGHHRLPVRHAEITFAMASGMAYLRDVSATLLGGALAASASFDLVHPDGSADVSWKTVGWRIEQLLRPGHEARASPLSGRLDSQGRVEWSARGPSRNVDGAGTLSLVGGNITAFPILNDIRAALQAFNILDATFTDDEFRANVRVDDAGLISDEFTFKSAAVGGRGSGRVNFDNTIDVTFSAGPVQRLFRDLGLPGRILTEVTGRLVRYRIVGTLDEPKISVQPLGVGL